MNNGRLRRTFWIAAQPAARKRDSFRDKLGRSVTGLLEDADTRREAMTTLARQVGVRVLPSARTSPKKI